MMHEVVVRNNLVGQAVVVGIFSAINAILASQFHRVIEARIHSLALL